MSENSSEKNLVESHSNKGITLELGDIIEIYAPSNSELHTNTFFITYLDDTKIRLANVSTFHPYVLKLGHDGRITDETVQKTVLLSRSDELGYARQHLLLPKTWVDIHFGGEVPTIITGEITNLEEDMIEITTYPDVETIYIDFEYKGIPETIPLKQIVIRTKPASLNKISSLLDVREQLEEGEIFEPGELLDDAVEMEYMETGEAVIKLPKTATPERTVRDKLHNMYSVASSIIYAEELEEIVQRVELPEHQKRFGIETQTNDMLDELLSEIPNAKRTKAVLDNIHNLIERFRELRQEFSKFDANGNVFDTKLLGMHHKPLVDRMLNLNAKLKWLIPVVALRRKTYSSVLPDGITDVVQLDDRAVLGKDQADQEEYAKNHMRGDVPSYSAYYEKIDQSMTPIELPLFPKDYMVPQLDVAVQIEGIVKNMEDFYSTVMSASNTGRSTSEPTYSRNRFVIQRYNLGQTKLAQKLLATNTTKQGRRVFVREPMTPPDKVTVGSMMIMPEPIIHFSKIDLPGSSIMTKTELAQNYAYLFKLLTDKTKVDTKVIEQFGQDLDRELWTNDILNANGPNKKAGEDEDADRIEFTKAFKEFVLAETLEQDPQRYRQFLEAMVPKTNAVIKLLTKKYPNHLSFQRIVDVLEPFLIYTPDLTYYQYNDIRFLVKTGIKDYRTKIAKRGDEMASLRSSQYPDATPGNHRMERILFEKRELFDMLIESYNLRVDMRERHARIGAQGDFSAKTMTAAEWMSKILKTDDARLFSDLVEYMMVSLVMPDNLADALVGQIKKAADHDEMSAIEKIKATDCARRQMTKRYKSIKELQKDNGEDIYYDKEFDDVPYPLMEKYKADQKKYSSEDFVDFLAENLIQKHDCPKNMAKELAADLITGRKLVRPGEFAIVELRPRLPEHVDESQLTHKELRELKEEADTRQKTLYYRRVGKHWVHDDGVDELAFIDSNTMFCNMDKICFKDIKSNVCQPVQDAEARMRQIARKRMIGEFDSRFAESVEHLQDELKVRVNKALHRIKRLERLHHVVRYKANNVAYEMGRFSKVEDILQSPYIGLRDKILGQDDFIKRQIDIVRFVELYCRDPMIDELGESFYWHYCTKTNTPLLPSFLFELAKAFTMGEDYAKKLGELRRKQGVLSDDGDSIVDRFSGYVICKIDSVQEDGYDEDGRKMVTNDVLEQDAGLAFLQRAEAIASAKLSKTRVFENETAETVFKVYSAIANKIGLPLDSVENFVMRLTLELIDKNVDKEEVYKLESDKIEKEKGKRRIPYSIYFNQTMLLILSAVILVSIQTAIPSFKIHKTFPGCVQSFRGYPMDGGSIEDTTGLKYLACVLNTLKSSIVPWNSIQKFPVEIIQTRLRSIIEQLIMPRVDLMELYAKKREDLVLHPEADIPQEHAIQKWTGFLPPVVEFTVAKNLRGLPANYKDELLAAIRNGNKEQREMISMFRSKSNLFGFAIIESIRTIVRSKDLLLKTASNMFFMENACCNDRNTALVLDYFLTDDETLGPHIKMVEGWSAILDNVKQLSRASILYDPKRTGIIYPPVPTEHYDVNVYAAFIHYCNLDRDLPIPEEMRALMAEKLPGYDPKWIMAEKIEFFKKEGKRFSLGNLLQLMEIVNAQNVVEVDLSKVKGSAVAALSDFLEYLDSQDTERFKPTIETPLRQRLAAVLKKYDPKTMIVEVNEETRRLNTYLGEANAEMLAEIAEFLQQHGNLSKRRFNQLRDMLKNIHMWNLDELSGSSDNPLSKADYTSMYTVVQFMKNSVYSMSKLYPEMIHNAHSSNTNAPLHWGLSANHNDDISHFLEKFYEPLQKFKGDPTLAHLLGEVQIQLVDLNIFLQNIPAFTPIHKPAEGDSPARTFNPLFSKRTLYMLYTYVWYSVLHEYIQGANDPDMLQLDVHERKEKRRQNILDNADPMALGQSAESFRREEIEAEDIDDMADEMVDVQIVAGMQVDLQSRVAQLLLTFLDMDETGKKMLDFSYGELEKRIGKSKLKEKKMITDFLRDMDADERRVEDTKKALKLGRWNVGMRKGLVNYDAGRYEEERAEFINLINGRTDLDEEEANIPIRRTADELEMEAANEVDEMYDIEATDIGGLDEDYMDGRYYDE